MPDPTEHHTGTLDLSGAGAELGGLPTGSHRTWVRVTDGDTVVVRAGGRLTVQ